MNCSIIFNRQVETTIRPSARWLFIFHIILLVIISVLFCCCCCIVLLTVARSAFTNGWIRVCVHSVCVSTSCRKGRQTNSPLRALNFYLTKQKNKKKQKFQPETRARRVKIKSKSSLRTKVESVVEQTQWTMLLTRTPLQIGWTPQSICYSHSIQTHNVHSERKKNGTKKHRSKIYTKIKCTHRRNVPRLACVQHRHTIIISTQYAVIWAHCTETASNATSHPTAFCGSQNTICCFPCTLPLSSSVRINTEQQSTLVWLGQKFCSWLTFSGQTKLRLCLANHWSRYIAIDMNVAAHIEG